MRHRDLVGLGQTSGRAPLLAPPHALEPRHAVGRQHRVAIGVEPRRLLALRRGARSSPAAQRRFERRRPRRAFAPAGGTARTPRATYASTRCAFCSSASRGSARSAASRNARRLDPRPRAGCPTASPRRCRASAHRECPRCARADSRGWRHRARTGRSRGRRRSAARNAAAAILRASTAVFVPVDVDRQIASASGVPSATRSRCGQTSPRFIGSAARSSAMDSTRPSHRAARRRELRPAALLDPRVAPRGEVLAASARRECAPDRATSHCRRRTASDTRASPSRKRRAPTISSSCRMTIGAFW